ncbi:MAG: glycoside hydrolase 43 family protein [Colwellia sp.]
MYLSPYLKTTLLTLSFICTFSIKAQDLPDPLPYSLKSYPLVSEFANNEETKTHYTNPIIHADYSDPDVVEVAGEYYMTASSFNAAPGLPILHSTDLVNWSLINYALPKQIPSEHFSTPQHGNGVWAPNIRYHNKKFWIFYPDPDFGIYVTTATDPAKKWSSPKLILKGKGLIDPTPLWDENGKTYLIHAWAKSRAGFNNVLSLREMSEDASWVSNDYQHIIDGSEHKNYRTIEGPKVYQRNGYYYIFAPAGGVDLGWQSVFRSKNITGPYQAKIVMAQGNSVTNGPHQGAWVHTQQNEDWFIHFQSKKAYGRIVHLQPMQWQDNWPIIGLDKDGDGIGQPVSHYKKPAANKTSNKLGNKQSSTLSDDFLTNTLGLSWQWNANPKKDWYTLDKNPGFLRLYAQLQVNNNGDNLWLTPSLLLQKLPRETFSATTKLTINKESEKAKSGLILFGENYAWIGVRPSIDKEITEIVFVHCHGARKGCNESILEAIPLSTKNLNSDNLDTNNVETNKVEFKVIVQPGASAVFSYRTDFNKPFKIIGEHFQAVKGRWVGAKIGLFIVSENPTKEQYIDVDYFRYDNLD